MISQGIKTSCKLGVVLGLLLLVGAGERSFTVIAGGEPGTLTTWTVPTPNPGLEGIAVSPSGEVYFAEFSGNKIGQLDPLGNTITEWLAGQGPRYLALGPSGEVYFTESAGDRISRLMPSHGFYSSEGVPTGGSQPLGIAVMTGVGSVSKIWFTEKLAGKLGALTLGGFVFDVVQPAPSGQQVVSPTTTALTPIVNTVSPRITPGNPALPPGIAAPPATTSGPFTEWQLLGSGQPRMLAVAPDGSLWISTETRSLLKFEPSSGTLTFYDLPMGSVSLDVAVDAVGNVWFTENYANKIGRLNPQNGDVTEWPLPGGGQPFALAIAPDGSVWFTEREGDRIGHLEPWSHTITEYQLPTGVHPLDIAVDAVGDVWFTTERAGTVNRLSIGPVLGPPPAPPGTDAILSVTVTPISATEADVTVEYSYSGSQGLPVFVGAWPTQGGGRAAEFGYVPARIDAPGTGTVTVRVKYSGSGCVSTDGLDVFLYDSGGTVFLTQNFPYAMQWQCAVGPPLPPPPPPAPAGLPTVNLQIDRGCGANYNPGDALIISISVSEAANVTLLDFDTSQRIQQFALGTLTPGLTRTITGTVTGPAGVETLVAVARTASGIYVSTGCSFSIGGVSLSLVSLTLDRGCDGLYHYGETATVTLNSSVTGWATLFNVTRTGQIKQLFLGRPIQAGVPLQLTAPIEAITGRSTLVAYVRDASGRNVTTWCSMNVLP